MAWHGQPVMVEELLFKDPAQASSTRACIRRWGPRRRTADGFGLGWYGLGEGPAVYRSVAPAWG